MTDSTEPDTPERTVTNDTTFTRRATLRAAGIAGAGALALGATTGSAGATEPCVSCVPLGKLEGQPVIGETHQFTVDGYTVDIYIEDVVEENGEVVAAMWKVVDEGNDYLAICQTETKGGPAIKTREEFDSSEYAYNAWANAPAIHERNPNRTQYAISFIQFYVCVPEELDIEIKEHPLANGPPGRNR